MKYTESEEWRKLQDNYYVKSRLKDGRYGSEVLTKRNKHRIWNQQSQKEKVLFDDVDVQKLFDKYAGTGTVETNYSGSRINKEVVYADEIIGIAVSRDGEFETNKFKIHHSKKRTHIVLIKTDKEV